MRVGVGGGMGWVNDWSLESFVESCTFVKIHKVPHSRSNYSETMILTILNFPANDTFLLTHLPTKAR